MLLDILIVVGVVLFIASRFLGHKLPTDTHLNGRPKGSAQTDVVQLLNRLKPTAAAPSPSAVPGPVARKTKTTAPTSGLAALAAADPHFNEAEFINGVKAAYAYFYDRYNAGDEAGLDNLCSPQLLAQLQADLAGYAKRGVQHLVQLEKIESVTIQAARLNGRTAIITVDIAARQTEGQVPVGDKLTGKPHTAGSTWVLARALTSDDPNWELQSIAPVGGQA